MATTTRSQGDAVERLELASHAPRRVPNAGTRVAKRCLDALGSGVGLVLLMPVFAAVGLTIRLSSPGPVFFSHLRIGQHGRPFRIVKFRTMRGDAEEVLRRDTALWEKYVANDFKLPPGEDPRITRIGRWLRKTSLDELPQLWNVFKGEMSLVGPRPIVKAELEQWYGQQATELLSVPPGMTGLWQVAGRSDIRYPGRVELELQYVRTQSIFMDLKLLFWTALQVLKGKGAH